jgi:hypothetical protein
MKQSTLVGWALAFLMQVTVTFAAEAARDLTGLWQLRFDSRSVPQPALTPMARRAMRGYQKRYVEGLRWCRIAGVPAQMEGPLDIQQGRIEIAIDSPMRSVARHLYIDGRAHVKLDDYDPTTVGDSVAHWEGDTLIVDTNGFSDRGLVTIPGGGFRTAKSHLIERFRLLAAGKQLSVTSSWIDSAVFVRPHSYEFRYYRAPANTNVIEWPCDPYDTEGRR